MQKQEFVLEEEYSISGMGGNKDYPYVNDIKTISEAVDIAKHYPDIYKDGYATHISRTMTVTGYGQSVTGMTHEYGITTNGDIEVLDIRIETDDALVESLKEYLEELSRPITREEKSCYKRMFDEAEKNFDIIIHLSKVSNMAGFRFIYFGSGVEFDSNLKFLVCHLLNIECNERVMRFFEKDIERLARRLADRCCIPGLPSQANHRLKPVA